MNYLNNVKSKVILLLVLVVTATTFAQETDTPEKVGVLTFKTEEIDYGTIKQNANGERMFSFTNTGDAPIAISNVKTSCGCTIPSYSKAPILPGESSEITVKYATSRLGVFKKTITVMSNASEPNKIIKIKGEVLKEIP